MQDHKFWGLASLFCMIMCICTGYSMTHPIKKKTAEKKEDTEEDE